MNHFNGRRNGKTTLMFAHINFLLDNGQKVTLASPDRIVTMERVNGVDFIINDNGTRDIDGSNLIGKKAC